MSEPAVAGARHRWIRPACYAGGRHWHTYIEFQYKTGISLSYTETHGPWINFNEDALRTERDPLKISRDRLQASIVEELANRFRLGV